MNRRKFIAATSLMLPGVTLLGDLPTISEYKTPYSVFTIDEIDEFCNEWGWIHVKEFIKNKNNPDHEYPYYIGALGCGRFQGVDGNEYMIHNTFRSTWIGDIKNDPANKSEFKTFLKSIAGDYYGRRREHYYFYDVMLIGGDPYDCYEFKKFDKDYEPNEYALNYHGKPHYGVTLLHMGVSHGKMWVYK